MSDGLSLVQEGLSKHTRWQKPGHNSIRYLVRCLLRHLASTSCFLVYISCNLSHRQGYLYRQVVIVSSARAGPSCTVFVTADSKDTPLRGRAERVIEGIRTSVLRLSVLLEFPRSRVVAATSEDP